MLIQLNRSPASVEMSVKTCAAERLGKSCFQIWTSLADATNIAVSFNGRYRSFLRHLLLYFPGARHSVPSVPRSISWEKIGAPDSVVILDELNGQCVAEEPW